jgi:hypothetical protein
VSTPLVRELTDIAMHQETAAPVVNEHVARAAAGITMVIGGVAFTEAYFERRYLPLQTVSILFVAEFAVRLTAGISRSPIGLVARWATRREPPYWVSAKPKQFAWTLGLAMSVAMAVITNLGIRGWVPRTSCLICLALMWLESALGLCLGCELHGFLVRRGWARKDEAFAICPHEACGPVSRPGPRLTRASTNSEVMT